ncbi:HAD family hydrolase [Hephaestia sp. GCM10023244]|uniref:HAD family hydrolase n=1 Tax=unclassified Hephaestia TaxID=2631281 RepID=UPI002076EFA3|nr:HAD family hydrolase [Hephaestia sp. MAHUQ-44]MCM8731031.1 HAD family hydrolase [Hephaestia sp. MAHUQ-44]
MKPLLICDCDEVLLHMVRHFGTWLGEAHAIDFAPDGGDFANSMTRRDGTRPSREEMWGLLGGFFPHQMHRQTLVPHAREALALLAETADIVILTNLVDDCRTARIDQLAAFGIAHRVECNQGGKGRPVARLVAEYGAPVAVFIDDLAVHHESVARHAPQVHRLQMVSEPDLAPSVPPAPHAHARIDDWRPAQAWILDRFAAGTAAEA